MELKGTRRTVPVVPGGSEGAKKSGRYGRIFHCLHFFDFVVINI